MSGYTPGAMRASVRIVDAMIDTFKAIGVKNSALKHGRVGAQTDMAEIITRETGDKELIEALEAMGVWLTDCKHGVEEGPQVVRQCPRCAALRMRADALAKAKGQIEPDPPKEDQ